MGLRPWDDADAFWDMSPADLQAMYEGYLAREDRKWFMSAWMVSHLMAPHVKGGKPPKVQKLLNTIRMAGRSYPFARNKRRQ